MSKKFPTLCARNNLTLIDMHNVFMSVDPICNTLLNMQYINNYEMFQLAYISVPTMGQYRQFDPDP